MGHNRKTDKPKSVPTPDNFLDALESIIGDDEESGLTLPSSSHPVPISEDFMLGGEVRNDSGEIMATAEVGDAFDAKGNLEYRLTIKERFWNNVTISCEGNAVEVETEPLSDGRYRVRKTVRAYKPAYVSEEETIELPKCESMKDFMSHVESLPTDMVKALRQIYYDKWNFDTGSTRDRMYYELLDEELKGRK